MTINRPGHAPWCDPALHYEGTCYSKATTVGSWSATTTRGPLDYADGPPVTQIIVHHPRHLPLGAALSPAEAHNLAAAVLAQTEPQRRRVKAWATRITRATNHKEA